MVGFALLVENPLQRQIFVSPLGLFLISRSMSEDQAGACRHRFLLRNFFFSTFATATDDVTNNHCLPVKKINF